MPASESNLAPKRRPLLLSLAALGFLLLGLLILLLAGVVGFGVITWDVKGHLLVGGILALFSLAVATVGALALGAAYGLWRGYSWGRILALGFWLAAGTLALVTDRSVSGPGEPLRTYLLDLMLLPGSVTALVLWGIPSVRRYFEPKSPRTATPAA